jgi:hypothetical protein
MFPIMGLSILGMIVNGSHGDDMYINHSKKMFMLAALFHDGILSCIR